MELYLLRHGQTEWNKEGKILGQTDVPLNEVGLQQMQDLLPQIPEIDALYTSPLERATQAAEIISNYTQLEFTEVPALMERDFGGIAGKTWDEFSEEAGFNTHKVDRALKYDYQPYGGESVDQVKQRLQAFLNSLYDTGFQKILIVTHAGIIRLMYSLYGSGKIPSIKVASIHHFTI